MWVSVGGSALSPMDDQTTSFEADFIHLYLHQVNSTAMNGFKDKDYRAESGSARRFLSYSPSFMSPKSFAKNPLEDLAGAAFR